MSKKPARSERDVDLPDWADEVTPADEVMKKFYAPTGTFRSGPINVQQPAPPAPEPSASNLAEEDKEGVVNNQTGSLVAIEVAPEKPILAPSTPTSVAGKEDKQEKASLPSFGREIRSPSEEKARVPDSVIPAKPVGRASTEDLKGTQTLSFEEFAKKWKRYLYPGQLAVMKMLFNLTIGCGTTECFTRYSEIATATKMTRRNCINVMNSLVERGFVKRLEVRNDATGKGIKLRIHTDPLL
jgi:DNA-binding MarR family transcriptional regulator